MDSYKGFKEVIFTDADMADFYNNMGNSEWCEKYNRFAKCLVNEYLIILNVDNEIKDYCKWNGTTFHRVTSKSINNDFVGKVKARNSQQVCAIDMLLNSNITVKVLTGAYGAGKDMLMICSALELIKKSQYDKIVWVRNNIEVFGCKPLGALPGSEYDKLLPFVLPLADHVGGIDGLELLIQQRKVEVAHLGYIRGRDIRNSIIYVTEAENTSKQQVKLLIGRVGEGSALWLNGDYNQTDSKLFECNNGLLTAIDKLKGHHRFGYVHMPKTERSETACMADLLDD